MTAYLLLSSSPVPEVDVGRRQLYTSVFFGVCPRPWVLLSLEKPF